MRTISITLQLATIAVFAGLFVLPNETAILLICLVFFAVGLWSVFYPAGILNWAKTYHRGLDPTDERLWSICRLIGICFVGASAVAAITIIALGHH